MLMENTHSPQVLSSSDLDTSFLEVRHLVSLHFFGDPAKVTPGVKGVTFSTRALVLSVTLSALHLRTLPQDP